MLFTIILKAFYRDCFNGLIFAENVTFNCLLYVCCTSMNVDIFIKSGERKNAVKMIQDLKQS